MVDCIPAAPRFQAALAQLGERQTEDLEVPSSILGGGIFFDLRRRLISFAKTLRLLPWLLTEEMAFRTTRACPAENWWRKMVRRPIPATFRNVSTENEIGRQNKFFNGATPPTFLLGGHDDRSVKCKRTEKKETEKEERKDKGGNTTDATGFD